MSGYEARGNAARRADQQLTAALKELGTDLKVGAEWQVVLALFDGGWPGTASQTERLAFVTFLGDLPPRVVMVALRTLARDGQRYRPTPSEVRQAVRLPAVSAAAEGEAARAWQLVLAGVKELVSDLTYHRWLEPLRCVGDQGDQLLLTAEDRALAQWAERRYLGVIVSVTQRVTSYRGVSFTFTLAPGRPAPRQLGK